MVFIYLSDYIGMKKYPLHFKAQINYFPTEKGGLITPVSTGYRSEIKFPFELESFIAVQNFEDRDLIFPGDLALVHITLLNAEPFLEKLYEGMDFQLHDNSGIIADGIVTEVY